MVTCVKSERIFEWFSEDAGYNFWLTSETLAAIANRFFKSKAIGNFSKLVNIVVNGSSIPSTYCAIKNFYKSDKRRLCWKINELLSDVTWASIFLHANKVFFFNPTLFLASSMICSFTSLLYYGEQVDSSYGKWFLFSSICDFIYSLLSFVAEIYHLEFELPFLTLCTLSLVFSFIYNLTKEKS